ncbi:MAG: glutamate--tRNA ligase, partial [Candidatus Paceibacteria bacterium]
MPRVRIAPSPTGPFHIGIARTALFNYLYAQQQEGQFVLRIEDTDTERSQPQYEQDIIEGLHWLGITPDEGPQVNGEDYGNYGPYRQSERIKSGVYRPYLQQLLDSGWAYYDDTSKEEIDRQRKAAEEAGEPFIFRGNPYKTDINYDQAVIRFRSPEDKKIMWQDKVRGNVEFNSSLLGDFVIAKGLDQPLYNFAVVVDDALMEITHVIRGEDHVSNTPKQMLLNEMLGFNKKTYAHIPLILGQDKSKLSKRHGATTVSQYQNQGYLPEAMTNFLALLGWRDPNDRELYTLPELIKAFRLKRIQKSGAVFDQDKLDHINATYIKQLSSER